jgi:RNA polymerase sigma-70 factor (ECF subfamily)
LLLFARQQTQCEADAQDLVQEAMVESWRRCAGNATPPVHLVFATIRRRAIDLARRGKRRSRREEVSQSDAPVEWFDARPEDRETMQLMQSALQQLPAEQREVITLKVWGDLTFAQIADLLEIPANTAASRYRYGLATLKNLTQEVLA